MELEHRFTVPAGIDRAWAHFADIEGVAGCFPGAAVTEADADSFSGTVKVKLGPIALVYNGSGTFLEKDDAAHRMVIDAKGKDKRGNGTAGAKVTVVMTAAGADATDVDVTTDLNITGKAAQFGRANVMKDVSDKLLDQFVDCLSHRLDSPAEESPEPAPAPPEESSAPAAPPGDSPAPSPPPTAPASSAPPPPAAAQRPLKPARDDADAINLGSTVLPVLARAYWKQGVAAAVVVALVVWWASRG